MTNDRQRRRLVIFLGFLGLVVLLLIARLAQLMLLRPAAAESGGITLPAVERGPILDRNGRVLAITTRLYSVTAWLPEVSDREGSAALLAEALELDPAEITRRFREASGFLFVKRKITPTQSERVRALQAEGRLKGIALVPEFGRNYPNQTLASHVLGYVGLDNVGLDGVEYTFNEELSPAAVSRADAPQAEEVFGNQVFLTIDADIQHMAERHAREALAANQADSVLVLVMEAGSGEILGYAAVPDFDPNEFNRFERSALRNLPLAQAFEPGSVFKIFSIASFLHLGGITPEDEFLCTGLYEKKLADGDTIRIRDLAAHGRVNAGLILKYSCNVGAAYASEKVQREAFYQVLLGFGFGRPTGLPLPGESAGILAPPARWSLRSKATISFGQEISVSAVQVLQAATAIANGGLLLAPRIVSKILSPSGELVKEFGRQPVREVISPQVAREVLEMMAVATEQSGTARRGAVQGVRISAKTGTAQVRDPATGTYSESNYVASYLGIFPTEEPRVIVYVVLHNPKGPAYYGSQIAAPVFRAVAEDLIGYLGIRRRGDAVLEQPGSLRVRIPPAIVLGETMPDLRGSPKRLLLPLLAIPGLEVRISGEGFVVEQDPPPGTRLQPGASIRLRLE
jgi:cell division protein FtsI (penicillin-binding protein 3)